MRSRISRAGLLLIAVLLAIPAMGQGDGAPAPTPPIGWNSWDSYGTHVGEAQVRANADAMARDLAKYGWRYIVVDIDWYAPDADGYDYHPGARLVMDGYGRLLPAVNRFPSAAGGRGFKPLADYVHSKGLKFGIHIMRGIPRQAVNLNLPVKGTRYRAADIADRDNPCKWNPDMWGVDVTRPGAQAYYDSIVELYASWGVDFIKADDMGSHLYQPAEIRALHRAIKKSGREIVLSISPGPAPVSEADFFAKYSQMWRISDDFWDDWKLLKKQFGYMREWAPFIGRAGSWPDADMLPLGRLRLSRGEGNGKPTRFTADEQYTLMTLWCIFRSPLIFGGDLPRNDEFTASLITNAEVLAVNQQSTNNHEAYARGNVIVWTANVPGSRDQYAAVFNIGDTAADLAVDWRDLGIALEHPPVRDLWNHRDLGSLDRLQVELRPHASALYRVSQP